MSAKDKRDILGELFRGDHNLVAMPGLEELDLLIHSCMAPKSFRDSQKGNLLPLKRKNPSTTKKTTHYLRNEIFEGLTQAKLLLTRLLPEGSKSKASKSKLVNHAVQVLLREIEEKGAESPMVKTIIG